MSLVCKNETDYPLKCKQRGQFLPFGIFEQAFVLHRPLICALLLFCSPIQAQESQPADGSKLARGSQLASGSQLANGYRTKVDEKLKHLLKEAIEDTSGFTDRFDAEVWLLDMSTRMAKQVPDPLERMEILKHVHREASRVNLQPELVLSVIQVESNFDAYAVSWVGARGLMQIMPFWLKEIGHPYDNLFAIKTNLRFGCTILSYYLEVEKGNLFRALGRYNGSVGKSRYPNKVFKAMKKKWYVQ